MVGKNNKEMYSTHNWGKSVVAEIFIRTLKNKYISHHSNTYHSAIKVKPIGVKSSAYIVSSKGIDNKSPKFKISDIIKISK